MVLEKLSYLAFSDMCISRWLLKYPIIKVFWSIVGVLKYPYKTSEYFYDKHKVSHNLLACTLYLL